MPFPDAAALNALNWALMLREAPKMVREARQLYETISRRRNATRPLPPVNITDPAQVPEVLAQLKARAEELEAHNARQAELISQLAAQGEALSEGLETLAGRMNALVLVTISATLVAIIALALAILN